MFLPAREPIGLRTRMAVLGLVIVLVYFVAGAMTPAAEAAPTTPAALPAQFMPTIDPCDLMPVPVLGNACDVGGIVVDAIGGAASDIATGAVNTIVSWFASQLSDSLKWGLEQLTSVLSAVPGPPLTSQWFLDLYGSLIPLSATLCLLMMIVHLILSVPRMSSELFLQIGRNTLVAFFVTMTAAPFVQIAIWFSDRLTYGIAQLGSNAAGHTIDSLMSSLTQISVVGAVPGLPIFFTVLILAAMFLTGLVLLFLMVLRSIILYLAVLAIPFVVPSMVDGKRTLAKAHAGLVFGIIVAEPIVVAIFAFGGMLLQNGFDTGGGLYAMVGGLGIMLVGVLMPLSILKAVLPASAARVVGQVQQGSQKARAAVGNAKGKATDFAKKAAATTVAGPAGAAAVSAAGPSRSAAVPPQPVAPKATPAPPPLQPKLGGKS